MKPVTRKRLNKFQVNFVQTKKGAGIKTTRVHYCISASDANPVLHQSEQGNKRGTDISESDLDAELQDSGYPDQDVHPQSSYDRRKEKLADGWSLLRESLVCCKMQTYGYPSSGAACVHCGSPNALVLCKDCGPHAYHCNECAVKHHSTINIMHRLMVWKVRSYNYISTHYNVLANIICLLNYARKWKEKYYLHSYQHQFNSDLIQTFISLEISKI